MSDEWSAEQAENCKRMWGACLLRNLQDALTPDDRLSEHGSGTSGRDRRSAQRWIGTDDFADVCQMAGFDPDFIKDSLDSGRITFDGVTSAFVPEKLRAAE